MRSADRMALKFAVALALAGITLIGWESHNIRAQDSPKADPPVAPKEELPTTPATAPSELPLPSPDVGGQSALEVPHARPAPFPDPIRAGQDAAAPGPVDPAGDDPEKNARAFVERNRKEAQDELKKLKDEADRLRTRLGKVEAGIRRWEALLGALEKSERIPPPLAVPPAPEIIPTAENPTQLEPVPRTKPATVIRESVPVASPAPAPR